MARRSRAKPPAAKAVFINCPFDGEFKPLLRAMVRRPSAFGPRAD